MTFCINPQCHHRENLDDCDYCHHCGTPLLINHNHHTYRLIEPLRDLEFSGSFEIFKVQDEQGNLKVLKYLAQLSHSHIMELFEQEARILTGIGYQHPGIPDANPGDFFPYTLPSGETLQCLVMEFIEGQNLETWVNENGVVPEYLALDWMQQILEILTHVHRHNFFHRDIKPSNIMLQDDGQLMLIDFGTARKVTETVVIRQGITVVYSGGYTAPEQLESRAVPESDFFALGRTFVYLLTHQFPSNLPSQDNHQLVWHEHLPASISPALVKLIDDLMAYDVSDRPRTLKEIQNRLAQILPSVSIEPITQTRRPGVSISLITYHSKLLKRVVFLFGGLVMFGGIGVVLNSWLRQQSASETAVKIFTHPDAVNAIAFHPNGEYLATASSNGTAQLWERTTGRRYGNHIKHSSSVVAIAFSPKTGKYLATAGLDGISQIRAFPEGRETIVVKHQKGVVDLAINADETILATASADGTASLWNTSNGARIQNLNGPVQEENSLQPSAYVRKIRFSREGEWVATASLDGRARLWQTSTGQEVTGLPSHKDSVLDIAFSPNSSKLVTASLDGTAKLISIQQKSKISQPKIFQEDSGLQTLSFSPDGLLLATINSKGIFRLWDIQQGSRFWSLNKNHVTSMAFSANGKYFATGHSDNHRLILWERKENTTYKQIACLQHQDRIVATSFSPNSQYLATASWDATARLWDIEKAQDNFGCQ
jgi:WD40 repeat protein